MRRLVKSKDVLLSLEGSVYLEGDSAVRVSKAVKRNKRHVLHVLREVAPTLKARELSIDSSGRVRIDNPKFRELALLMAQPAGPSTQDLRKAGRAARVPKRPKAGDDEGKNDLNFICPGDGGVDLACYDAEFDDNHPKPPLDVNFICGFS